VSVHQALEKNQQWMTYDQQREAYVRSVLAHTAELEQQLAHIKQANPEGDGLGLGRGATPNRLTQGVIGWGWGEGSQRYSLRIHHF